MAGFNTFATKITAAEAAQDSTVSVVGQLLPPTVDRVNYTANFKTQSFSNNMEGFNSDGDYVVLPISAATNLQYFNSSDVSQFSIARTTIAAASDDWVGFTFDQTDSLIYVVVVDQGTTPNNYFLASVDASGTVVNIGNAQPGSDFQFAASAWFHTPVATNGASNIQRLEDGSGNMFVRTSRSLGLQEMEINIATGAIVSDPSMVDPLGELQDLAWRAESGIYHSIDLITSPHFFNANTGFFQVQIVDPENFGWSISSADRLMQWKGRVVNTQSTLTTVLSNRLNTSITTYDAWIDLVAKTYGFSLG